VKRNYIVLIENGKRFRLSKGSWSHCPCAAFHCTIHWRTLPGDVVEIQHGDNPEAVHHFQAIEGWVSAGDINKWLASVHRYEGSQDATETR